MNSLRVVFYVLLCLWLLSACTAPNRDYVDAKSLSPIQLPSTANGERLGELFPVPKASESGLIQTSTPLPPTIGVQSSIAATAFVLGQKYWVLNDKSPSTTWSQLLEFWQSQQVEVVTQNVSSASMATAWFTEAIQPGFEVRYQMQLIRGLQYESTEIFITNQTREISVVTPLIWNTEPVNPNHVQWLVPRLEAFLNNATDPENDSFLASTLNLPARVNYLENTREVNLLVDVGSELAPSVFTQAFQQQDLHLYDSDPVRGLYYIDESNRSKTPGFFSRLTSSGATKEQQSPYSLKQLLSNIKNADPVSKSLFGDNIDDKNVENNVALEKVPGYLAVITPIKEGVQKLSVRQADGEYMPLEEARVLMDTIRRQLK